MTSKRLVESGRAFWVPLAAACAVALMTGCGLLFESASYTPVNYYDIGRPQRHKTPPVAIKMGTVKCEGPENSRMAFRTSPTCVKFDEFNRWSQTPDRLVKRYLLLYLNDPALADVDTEPTTILTVDLKIICFECDLTSGRAVLIVDIAVKKASSDAIWSGTYHEETELNGKTASAYSEAMSKAAQTVADKFSQKLLELAPRLKAQ